jgi:hypothetical protein
MKTNTMKKMIKIIGILLTALVTQAGTLVWGDATGVFGGGGGGGGSFLINQNFEGAGYDNSESWTEGGTWDEDYTTTVLTGSQSCHHVDGGSLTSPDFAAQSDVWIYLQIQFTSVVDNTEILSLRSSGGADLAILKTRPVRLFRIECGSVPSADTSDAFSTATKLHVWIHYTKGTGGNGFASIGYSTDGTKPTAGNKYTQVTTGDATADGVRLRFNGEVGNTYIVDRILISASSIGDNP